MGVVADDDGEEDRAEREGDAREREGDGRGGSGGARQRVCSASTRSNNDSAVRKGLSHVNRRVCAGEAVPWNGMHTSALYAAATENMLDTTNERKGAAS